MKNIYEKINKKIKEKVVVLIMICLLFLGLGLLKSVDNRVIDDSNNNAKNVLQTVSEPDKLSNKKIKWGMKRGKNHEQPSFDKEELDLITKYQGLVMGNQNEKKVYLTFDEGYEAGYTTKILDILKENNVKATFFITAHYLNGNESLVQRMIDEGHIIANHTVNHKSLAELNEEEIKNEISNLHTIVCEKFNYEMKYIRPPKGEFNEIALNVINKQGYTPVLWSFAYDDWDENNQKGEEYAKSKFISNIHNSAIILLHGNSKDNMNILNDSIIEIKNMGFEFKSLDEFKK